MHNKREFVGCFFLTIAVLISLMDITESYAETRGVHPIYDARKSLKTTEITAGDISLLKRVVFPAAERFWKKKGKDCERELEAIDVARGSFTKTSSNQKAILYKYCTTGHNFALNGIAVVEENRIVAHVAYEGAWDNAIGALPDIDGNGLSEIIITTGGMNMGEVWGVISLLEISGHIVKKIGRTETYNGECEAVGGIGRSTAYRIWSTTGPSSVFKRETFIQDCNGGKWKQSGISQMKMDKDEVHYEIIN